MEDISNELAIIRKREELLSDFLLIFRNLSGEKVQKTSLNIIKLVDLDNSGKMQLLSLP